MGTIWHIPLRQTGRHGCFYMLHRVAGCPVAQSGSRARSVPFVTGVCFYPAIWYRYRRLSGFGTARLIGREEGGGLDGGFGFWCNWFPRYHCLPDRINIDCCCSCVPTFHDVNQINSLLNNTKIIQCHVHTSHVQGSCRLRLGSVAVVHMQYVTELIES